jgi:putative oxidoreductase
MKWLNKYSDYGYAVLRMMAGAMFSFHGAQKVLGFLAESTPRVGSQIWIGGVIELTGGLLILVGFKTSWAAFIASGQMAVAYFQFHWKFQFGPEFFPIINKGELSVLYCFVFLYFASRGGVKWCIDKTEKLERALEQG